MIQLVLQDWTLKGVWSFSGPAEADWYTAFVAQSCLGDLRFHITLLWSLSRLQHWTQFITLNCIFLVDFRVQCTVKIFTAGYPLCDNFLPVNDIFPFVAKMNFCCEFFRVDYFAVAKPSISLECDCQSALMLDICNTLPEIPFALWIKRRFIHFYVLFFRHNSWLFVAPWVQIFVLRITPSFLRIFEGKRGIPLMNEYWERNLVIFGTTIAAKNGFEVR